MKKISLIIVAIVLSIIGFISFSNCEGNKKKEETKISSKDKQLNITFLLDLSDRIEPSLYNATPSHSSRDIAIINQIVELFKKDMRDKGAFKMKGKIRVIFNPIPQDADINTIASKLNIDVSSMKPAEKKQVYDELQENFTENLQKIYTKTLENKKYIGSDIWRFFKNDVKDLAIDKNPAYRNILIVITDGYIYHENTKMKEGNKYSYLLPQLTKSIANSNYKENIEKKDFGLINPRPDKDLENLEVIMLELNPSKQSPYEEDVMNEVLSKWFDEMGVSKYKIYKTDITENTKKRIEDFIGDK